MFVKRYGYGPREFFCIHGWSGDHRTFEPLAAIRPDDVTLFCADLPGCGDSPEPAHWELASIARQIQDAIEANASGPVTLVGNCIGALLGLRAASERPAIIGRIVLIDAFARWPWYFRIFTIKPWGRYAYLSTFANPLGRWLVNQSLAEHRSEESDLTEGFVRARHEVALHYLNIMRELPSHHAFARLDVPADIVFGVRTFREVRHSAEVWQSLWPGARTWEVRNGGHLILQEAPGAVGEILFGGGQCQPASADTSTCTSH